MADNPNRPTEPESKPPASPERHGPPSPERHGPLSVERLRKDDGRALILYEFTPARD